MKIKKLSIIFCGLLMLIGCTATAPQKRQGGAFRPAAHGMGIEGRVVSDSYLIENAYVYVYKDVENGFRTRPFRISDSTDSEGRFQLDLPPGRYYVLARKYQSGAKFGPLQPGDYYSYYGGNPVAVRQPGYLWIGLNSVKEVPLPPDIKWPEIPLEDVAGIRGIVYHNNEPVENAYVYLYLDEKTHFKGEAFQVARTNKDGHFYLYTLPESDYFLVVRKRKSGSSAGPVQVGDLYAYYGGNPVFAALDEFASVRIDCISKAAEIGKESLIFEITNTRIEGVITDGDGKPLIGMYAFVYLDRNMSHGRPPYLSMITRADGRFILYLPQGGMYFLGARAGYGDAPQIGELYGRYEGTADHSIKIKSGQTVRDITIAVEPILGN